MRVIGSRGRVAKRVLAAHVFGLSVTGIVDTAITSEGFSLGGALLGLFLGGFLSLPWMAALGIAIWWRGGQIERHPLAFALLGPVLVVTSWLLVAGVFAKEVVIASVASSALYLATVGAQHALALLRPNQLHVR